MKSKFNFVPEVIKVMLRKTSIYKKNLIKKGIVVTRDVADNYVNKAPNLYLRKSLNKKPRIGIIISQGKSLVDGYIDPRASWLRYERFCKENDIPYGFYDIERSDWIKESEQYDILVCHTESTPAYQEMIESKIYLLEKFLGKTCFPNYHEIWQYEHKNRANFLYEIYNLPTIPTKLTYSKSEAIDILSKTSYPFITKTTIGAGSSGVSKIDSKCQALKQIKKIFSYKGLKSQYPYYRQKDYIYVQEYIDDATFDLRIMIAGDMAFGYYRYPNKGDFRASGAGNTEKKSIPEDALKLAISIRNKLNSRQMGVDLLYSEKKKQYFIIETSLFNQIDTPEQLEIDGVPGYYDISDINNITFKEGRFWIQEVILRSIIEEWSSNNMLLAKK